MWKRPRWSDSGISKDVEGDAERHPLRCEVEGIALAIAMSLPSFGPISLAAGAGFGIAAGTWAIALGLTYIGLAAGLTLAPMALRALIGKPGTVPPADGQVITRQSLPSRKRSYGLVSRGGDTAFQEYRAKLYWEILHNQGQIDSFVAYFLGNTEVQLNGVSRDVLSGKPWADPIGTTKSKVKIYSMTGTAAQTAFPQLVSAFAVPGFGVWGGAIVDLSNHRWRGVAKSLIVYENITGADATKYYGSGVPPLRVILRSSLIYDPRNGAQIADGDPDRPTDNGWTYSDNAGMVLLDYLRHPDGWKRRAPGPSARRMVPISRFYLPEWLAFISCCDEDVTLQNGMTEKRWRLAGTYDLTGDPKTVLEDMQKACDAEVYIRGDGKIGIHGGRWMPPQITIPQKHIVSHSLKPGSGKLTAFNRLNLKYCDPEQDFQMVDADIWRDEDNIALRGEEIAHSDELTWCPSHRQCRAIGKIMLALNNPEWQGDVVTNAFGLKQKARENPTVSFEIPEYFDARPFRRTKYKPASNLSVVEWSICSVDKDAYDWNPAEDEGNAPEVSPDTTNDNLIEVPASYAATAAAGPRLSLSWAAYSISNGIYSYEVNWRKVGDPIWQARRTATGATSFLSPIVLAGQTYETRIKRLSPALRASDWTSTINVNT